MAILGRKVYKSSRTWWYHKFKGLILLITDLKRNCFLILARVYKQVIFKNSGCGIYIKLSLFIETSLIWHWIIFYDFLFSLWTARESGKFTYFRFIRTEIINFKKGAVLLLSNIRPTNFKKDCFIEVSTYWCVSR